MHDRDERPPEDYARGEDVLVVVLVGPDKEKFTLHKMLICHWSKYFKCCIEDGKFSEGETGEVHLIEDDPDAFGMIVTWLYGWDLKLKVDADEIRCVKAWILANKLVIPKFKDEVMNIIGKRHNEVYWRSCLLERLPWETYNSDLRIWKYYVDMYACRLSSFDDDIWTDGSRQKFAATEMDFMKQHSEFTANVLQTVVGRAVLFPTEEMCTYHEHLDGEECNWKHY